MPLTRICPICKKEFSGPNWIMKKKKYCSLNCSIINLKEVGKPYRFTSESVKGSKNLFYGRQHTEESKEKNRLAHLGKKIHSEEDKKRISEMFKKLWKDPNYRKRKIKPLTEEHKRKLINGIKQHDQAIFEEIKNLEKQGYKCLDIGSWHAKKPDIITTKNGKIYAIEIEFSKPDYNKYNGQKFFDDIIWIIKKEVK